MDPISSLPKTGLQDGGPVTEAFLQRAIKDFQHAASHVRDIPYGHNTRRDDPLIVFHEGRGTCTTKHSLIATLAEEQGLDVGVNVGIYAMDETLVTGVSAILSRYGLSYIPEMHCFLGHDGYRVDLTEGNCNGKNRSIERYFTIIPEPPCTPDEERLTNYRRFLEAFLPAHPEFSGFTVDQVMAIREECAVHLREQASCALATSRHSSTASTTL